MTDKEFDLQQAKLVESLAVIFNSIVDRMAAKEIYIHSIEKINNIDRNEFNDGSSLKAVTHSTYHIQVNFINPEYK